MGIFSRVRDIFNSNINAILDKAEDPEKLIRLMIQEMEDTLVELKASTAGAMATRKRVQRQLEGAQEKVALWAGRAEMAVAKGREDLAREALLEKRRHEERQSSLENDLSGCDALINQYQEDIAQLEAKLAKVREKQRLLIARHAHAGHKLRAQGAIRRADTSDAFVRFERFESRVDRMEAEADLVNFGRTSGLDAQFSSLEKDETIERELEELKKKRAAGK
ncbi:phage shock protein PspA [bacterium]|nr:phage shock protein PspA [bacterium]